MLNPTGRVILTDTTRVLSNVDDSQKKDVVSWGGRKFSSTQSEGEGKAYSTCCAVALGIIMLIIAAVLWPVGASQGNATMVLAGQCLLGLGLGKLVFGVLATCCGACTEYQESQQSY